MNRWRMRQHALGPSPLDPNLISQGVPLDDRVTARDNIFGPVEGTPLAARGDPRGTPPGPPAPGSVNVPPTAPTPPFLPGPPPETAGKPGRGPKLVFAQRFRCSPSVATARYDPATGRYVTRDGQMFRQADLARSSKPKTWKDMLITAG